MKLKRILLFTALLIVSVCAAVLVGCQKAEQNAPSAQTVTVNFVDAEENLLQVVTVEKGSSPVYTGETPTRTGSEGTQYVFAGWEIAGTVYEDALPAVYENTVIRASFLSKVQTFTVEFSVCGQIITQEVAFGEIPAYGGETEFVLDGMLVSIVGWDKEFAPVYGDQRYTAIVETEDGYIISFDVEGEVLAVPVPVGSVPAFYGTPYKKGTEFCTYEFTGWQCGDEFYAAGETLPAATQACTYTAVFKAVYMTFTVRFLDYDGALLAEQKTEYGSIPDSSQVLPSRESDDRFDYRFDHWECEGLEYSSLPAISEDMEFVAVYEKSAREFTLSIRYTDGTNELGNYTANYTYGEIFSVASPTFADLAPRIALCTGFMEQDTALEVVYAQFDVWDGTDAPVTEGTGTAEDPYLIVSGAQLYRLAIESATQNFAGKYFVLNNDIDLNGLAWKAIGSYSLPFAGNFDGNGHAIIHLQYESTLANTNANSGHGLFSTVSGTIRGLIVEGTVRSVAKYTAILAGNNQGEITGCTTYGQVYGFGNVGGVFGFGAGNAENCINYAQIFDNGNSGCYRFGGVAGCATGTLRGCVNYGAVRVSAGTGSVGGVVGKTEGGAVIDCKNYGLVSSTKSNTGGVVGYAGGEGSSMENVSNYAPVFGASYTGGVFGYAKETDAQIGYNEGIVRGAQYVGGIAGYSSGTVQAFENRGMVYATKSNAGGIVGYSLYRIADCENYGEVTSESSSVGGIAGSLQVDTSRAQPFASRIENCKNYARITSRYTGTNSVIGGIVGRADMKTVSDTQYKPEVADCTNYGHVFANGSYTGGVIGACNGAVIAQSVNYGRVDASALGSGAYVGGIAGSNYGYGAVSGCTNYGTIAGNSSVGQICGQLTSTSTSESNQSFGKVKSA